MSECSDLYKRLEKDAGTAKITLPLLEELTQQAANCYLQCVKFGNRIQCLDAYIQEVKWIDQMYSPKPSTGGPSQT